SMLYAMPPSRSFDSLALALSSRPATRTAIGAVAAPILLAATLCVWLSGGYFLADDFAHLAYFGHWDAARLAAEVARKFHASIDGVGGFYRPLTYFTYAVSYVLSGGNARGWLAVNLALHLGNAVLVGWLVVRLVRHFTGAALVGALLAGVVFFAFSPGC